jgi:hypothetical protein
VGKGLNELRDEALRIAVEHGFTDASIGEDVALFHSEASELLENHREGDAPTKVWYEEKIRVFNVAGQPVFTDDGKPVMAVVRHREQRTVDGRPTRKPCGIPSELADIVVRIAHFAGKHGVDLAGAVEEKMAYNATRPFKHGNKVL